MHFKQKSDKKAIAPKLWKTPQIGAMFFDTLILLTSRFFSFSHWEYHEISACSHHYFYFYRLFPPFPTFCTLPVNSQRDEFQRLMKDCRRGKIDRIYSAFVVVTLILFFRNLQNLPCKNRIGCVGWIDVWVRWHGKNRKLYLQIHLRLLQHPEDQQL